MFVIFLTCSENICYNIYKIGGNMENLYNDNAVRRGFFKVNPILIIVLMAIFIPVSVLTSICYFQTKTNNNLPTFFSSVIVTSDAKFENENISVGDKILIKKQNEELAEQIIQIDLDNKVLVAYFDAVEEETENGSPVRIGYLQYFGKDADDQWVYGFVGNEKLIIGDAIIGVYETNASAKIGLTSFASSNLGLVLLSLLPLGAIFVLLVLDIFEQKRIKETNQEIRLTLHPETKIQNQNSGNEKIEKDNIQKQQSVVQSPKIVEQPKNVQVSKTIETQKQPAKSIEQNAKASKPVEQNKVQPSKPVQSQTSAQPSKPAETQNSAQQPKTNVAPPKPSAPQQKPSASPAKPIAPAKPTTPAKPIAPAKPTTPAKPSAPAKPTAPEKLTVPPKPNGVPQRPANLPPKK